MERLARKIALWFIGIVVFIGAYDLVELIFEGSDYKFNFKSGIAAPCVSYIIFCVLMFIFSRIGKKNSKKEK